MPQTAGASLLSGAQFYSTSSVGYGESLGELHWSQLGQAFRYVKAGAGAALVKGNLLQAAAENTDYKDMAVQAAVATSVAQSANGGYPIPVTLGSSATTAGQFNGGQLTISASNGIGQTFTILSNDVAASGTCNFYVLEQPLTALTTSSKATAYPNLWAGVIQNPTTSTGVSLGGAVTAIPLSNFGYIQSWGPGSVLGDSTATSAPNSSMSPSVATAGAATKQVSLAQTVGVSMSTVSVSAEVEGIYWRCL